jgi:SAM-dependent methyltransferase
MLSVARRKLPTVDLRQGDLTDLPVPDRCANLAVCALALTHLEDLTDAYAEFARVLKPGGRLVVSDTHSLYLTAARYPLIKQLVDGEFGYLPGWEHSLADHLDAALRADFAVQRVSEFKLDGIIDPGLAPEDLRDAPVPDPWPLMTWVSAAANAAWAGAPASMYLQLQRISDGG